MIASNFKYSAKIEINNPAPIMACIEFNSSFKISFKLYPIIAP